MQKLEGVVQNYAWGDRSYIADLVGKDSDEPQAEYWLGAHPRGAATLADGSKLDQVIAADPESVLGSYSYQRYGQLPYLLKILAASKPLSIQCHPSKQQAEAGFARENGEGVALDSPVRTYRDDNHKPELICALTPFEAKVGFRSVDETNALIRLLACPALDELADILAQSKSESDVIRDALSYLLQLPETKASEIVAGAVTASNDVLKSEPLAEGVGVYRSVLEWTPKIEQHFPGDIGVVVALLLNHVSLEPHQAIGLKAGNLHCYLSGVGVELMANSDNVVRGGMTPKNIDVHELLNVVDPEPSAPSIDIPGSDVHRFVSPADEFALTRVSTADSVTFDIRGAEIWVVTSGQFTISSASETVELGKGEACFVSAEDTGLNVSGTGEGWRAEVGG